MFQASTMGADPYDWYLNGDTGYSTTPSYNPGTEYPSSGGGLDWQSIINQGFGAASQIFSAWGRNPTQQTGVGGIPIGGGYSPSQILGAAGQLTRNPTNVVPNNGVNNSGGIGNTVGSGLDGIFNWAATNPVPVFIGIAGLFLLFREPPRGRR